MKGFVPTPEHVVDLMVGKLFLHSPPSADSTLLDPGCGRGAFIDGVLRWCAKQHHALPTIVGIESDPAHARYAAQRFAGIPQIRIRCQDFLHPMAGRFDYIVGNPPYVPITALSIAERDDYRAGFVTARGRFDLYMLFFEQALNALNPGGRLIFITPEKFLYVDTARPLRALMAGFGLEELHYLDEATFEGLVTYPLVSTFTAAAPPSPTQVLHRNGATTSALLHGSDGSWLPRILGGHEEWGGLTLADICVRISCGVATGADAVFTVRDTCLTAELRRFAYPTIAGRQLTAGMPPRTLDSLLVPYSLDGTLLPEARLGALGRYLADPGRRRRLRTRTCVARKPWYAFHETPPLEDVLRPKLLCKDIGAHPAFILDRGGVILPRHSVYYIVPKDPGCLDTLMEYLNSPAAQEWLRSNCQRAANGFLRLQSQVLKRLPIPESLGTARGHMAEPPLAEVLAV